MIREDLEKQLRAERSRADLDQLRAAFGAYVEEVMRLRGCGDLAAVQYALGAVIGTLSLAMTADEIRNSVEECLLAIGVQADLEAELSSERH